MILAREYFSLFPPLSRLSPCFYSAVLDGCAPVDAPLPVERGLGTCWRARACVCMEHNIMARNKKTGLTELDRYARTARHSKERGKGVVSGCIFPDFLPYYLFSLIPYCLLFIRHVAFAEFWCADCCSSFTISPSIAITIGREALGCRYTWITRLGCGER